MLIDLKQIFIPFTSFASLDFKLWVWVKCSSDCDFVCDYFQLYCHSLNHPQLGLKYDGGIPTNYCNCFFFSTVLHFKFQNIDEFTVILYRPVIPHLISLNINEHLWMQTHSSSVKNYISDIISLLVQ